MMINLHLENISEDRDLGIISDDELSFHRHVSMRVNRVN